MKGGERVEKGFLEKDGQQEGMAAMLFKAQE
jgi:hypothetical protein